MGCGGSVEVSQATKDIDSHLKLEKKRLAKEIKLLLLGAGESGKSTIAKQMKIIHLNGFTKAELMGFKPVLHSNAIEIVQTLVQGCDELGIQFDAEYQALAEKIEELSSIETPVDQTLKDELLKMWDCPAVKEANDRKSELQLPSSADYIMGNLDRYSKADFIPTPDDVLKCRARTTGIHEIEFDVKDMHFRMVDVGGQRSERKKWAHCFEDVTAIMFVVAMDGYDMKLYEDENVNRIQEARKLFDDIVNSKWFQHTSIILFLNKSDLFKEKVKRVDLKVCFSDYKSGDDYDEAAKFLRHKFKKLNRRSGREIYAHITCATDTENVKFVFNAVKDTVFSGGLKGVGM